MLAILRAVQGSWGEVVAGFPWDGDASWFGSVLELMVAALRRDEAPTIVMFPGLQAGAWLGTMRRTLIREPFFSAWARS